MINTNIIIVTLITISTLILLTFIFYKANRFFDQIFEMIDAESQHHLDQFLRQSKNNFYSLEEENQKNIAVINENVKVIKELNEHLSNFILKIKIVNNSLNEIEKKIESQVYFENEIIKYKKIIKRLENRS